MSLEEGGEKSSQDLSMLLAEQITSVVQFVPFSFHDGNCKGDCKPVFQADLATLESLISKAERWREVPGQLFNPLHLQMFLSAVPGVVMLLKVCTDSISLRCVSLYTAVVLLHCFQLLTHFLA